MKKNASSLATTRTHILLLSASTAAENISLDFSNMCIIYFIKRQSREWEKKMCIWKILFYLFWRYESAHSSRTYIDISRAPTTIWQYKLGGSYFELTSSSSSCAGVPQNQEEELGSNSLSRYDIVIMCDTNTQIIESKAMRKKRNVQITTNSVLIWSVFFTFSLFAQLGKKKSMKIPFSLSVSRVYRENWHCASVWVSGIYGC